MRITNTIDLWNIDSEPTDHASKEKNAKSLNCHETSLSYSSSDTKIVASTYVDYSDPFTRKVTTLLSHRLMMLQNQIFHLVQQSFLMLHDEIHQRMMRSNPILQYNESLDRSLLVLLYGRKLLLLLHIQVMLLFYWRLGLHPNRCHKTNPAILERNGKREETI